MGYVRLQWEMKPNAPPKCAAFGGSSAKKNEPQFFLAQGKRVYSVSGDFLILNFSTLFSEYP